jgi:riboflavin kinase/FMN adenylyltransferase
MTTALLDWTESPPPGFTGGAVTVGNFDGVHRGHRTLVAAARQRAAEVVGPTVVVTFDPPPYQVLFPEAPTRPPLTTLPDRISLLQEVGADHVVVLRTTSALLALTPEAFVRELLVRKLSARFVVEGYNFRFGHARAGDTHLLRSLCPQNGMRFEEVAPFTADGEAVSSSRVRAALVAGEVAAAARWLGRPYRIVGTIVTGAQRGRTIGFPTANLADVPTVLPGNGVYAVRAEIDGSLWPAAANIGPNPTFGVYAQKIEVHLIGFSGDVYGKPLAVEFIDKLRDTRPFAGAAELVQQLQADIASARRILGSETTK